MENPRQNFTQNNFDLVRLFAASQVLLFEHGINYLVRLSAEHPSVLALTIFGETFRPFRYILDFHGVAIFFVVSGFLISASYERSTSLVNYLKNRALRIYPALWLCLLFSIAIVFCLKVPFNGGEFFRWVAAQATILQNYNPDFFRNYGLGRLEAGYGVINGSLWTIPIELEFYLVFPCLFFVLKKLRKGREPGRILPLVVFSVFLFAAWWCENYAGAYSFAGKSLAKCLGVTFIPHFYLFLFGWILQRNFDWLGRFFRGKALYWLAGYFALLLLRDYAGIYFPRTSFFQFLVLGCVALSFAYTLPALAARITRGNDISYGVYIYHMLVVSVFLEIGFYGWLRWECLLSLLATTYLLAFLSWHWVEKPILALKKSSIHNVSHDHRKGRD
jgi:peptidoglycan/LPS O-acetylase OafA/YrhL